MQRFFFHAFQNLWLLKVGVRNYVLFAADAEAQAFFKELGAPSFYYAETVRKFDKTFFFS
jgi:hypothetical protein